MLFGIFPFIFFFVHVFRFHTHTYGRDAAFLSIVYRFGVFILSNAAFVYNPLNSVPCVPLAGKHFVFTVFMYVVCIQMD